MSSSVIVEVADPYLMANLILPRSARPEMRAFLAPGRLSRATGNPNLGSRSRHALRLPGTNPVSFLEARYGKFRVADQPPRMRHIRQFLRGTLGCRSSTMAA